ncbi:Hypothetical protein I595_1955 [Croceitalea dokdonensis DOKDO 023]|uniref:Uncharacterized protein n=1 Tax=Croceitalea dokdonensis DOKDO 023 TaxID=1300341 RepID=A0A0P7B297_9FLAO|nr:Hypothetical protein I595_1955 [Croceitalea dokdonensis DOKDO 023]
MLPIPYLVKIPFGYVVINQIYSLIQPKLIVYMPPKPLPFPLRMPYNLET